LLEISGSHSNIISDSYVTMNFDQKYPFCSL